MEKKRSRESEYYAILLLTVVALGAVGVLLFATDLGIGAYNDSARYIAFARNLSSGRGLGISTADGRVVLDTTFLPLYPGLLAVPGALGLDPLDGARLLQALLFGANVFLVGWMVRTCTGKSMWMPMFASLIMLTSVDMLHVHAVVWTEALFVFLTLLGFLWLNAYLESPRTGFLIGSSVVIGLATLDRYIGVAAIATGIVGLLFFNPSGPAKKLRATVLFVCISGLPLTLWLIRNAYVVGADGVTGRGIFFHPITLADIETGIASISIWLLPTLVPENVRLVVLFLVAALLIAASIMWFLRSEAIRKSQYVPSYTRSRILLFPIFIVIYFVFFIIARSFFDAALPLNYRLLSPVFVAVLMFVAWLGYQLFFALASSPFRQVIFTLLCVTFLAYYAVRGANWAINAHHSGNGLNYSSRAWRDSLIIQEVSSLPSETVVYSNGWEAIYLLTGRIVYRLPTKMEGGYTGRINERYITQLESMGAGSGKGGRPGVFQYHR